MDAIAATRRTVLTGVGLGVGGAANARSPKAADPFSVEAIDDIYRRYAAFGDKSSGGQGDNDCGRWIEGTLDKLGYRCQRQAIDVPYFKPAKVELGVGALRAALVPQAIVVQTPPAGLRARLHLAGPSSEATPQGAIALIPLAPRRWSALRTPDLMKLVQSRFDQGAAAVVLITNGPTGEALALNAPIDKPLFDKPVAVMAPREAQPFLQAAEQKEFGVLTVVGEQGRRPAFNNIATLSRGHERTLVVSTPRSGWFRAMGERGPGLAAWLGLARWAAERRLPVDLTFLCTSGHEYDNAGGIAYLGNLAPAPARTALWAHLGANVAARDWHDLGPNLQPLSSADPQRYMVASDALLGDVRRAFAGQPGLQDPYPVGAGAAGELTHVIAAGYPRVFGVFGAHRFHHAPSDDLRCVVPELAASAGRAFARVIEGAVQR